jgi:hypothetical protein
MQSGQRTRIFLSAGGNEQPALGRLDEAHITKDLIQRLEKPEEGLGYEVYFALPQQSTEDLVNDIFQNLKNSEYYLFIDFKREKLTEDDGSVTQRGSLFSNQELAIAQFQRKKIIAFQEDGVKKLDGILRFIHVNATPFSSRDGLVDKIIAEVKVRWDNTWKNQLKLYRKQGESAVVEFTYKDSIKRSATFFHVDVQNKHNEQAARDCYVFVEKITDLGSGLDITPAKLVEFKWEGVTSARITIPPQITRSFDGLYIFHDEQKTAYLGVNPFIVDFSKFIYTLPSPGRYEMSFVVYSNDFSPGRDKFILDVDGSVGNTKFYRSGESPVTPPTPQVGEVLQVAVPVDSTSGTTMMVPPWTSESGVWYSNNE